MIDKLTSAAKVLAPYIKNTPDYWAGVAVGAILLTVYTKSRDKHTVKLTEHELNRLRNGFVVEVITEHGTLYIENTI